MRRRVGVHDVALRRRLIGLIQQSSIRVECRQLHPSLWLGLGFQRGRPTLDRSLGHNRSLSAYNRSLGHNRSLGYNGLAALPFTSANFQRKTGHANQNNWHIAIFSDPLRQQAAVPHPQAAWFQSLPILLFTRKRKCAQIKVRVSAMAHVRKSTPLLSTDRSPLRSSRRAPQSRGRCCSNGLEEGPIQPYVGSIDTWPNDWAASPRY